MRAVISGSYRRATAGVAPTICVLVRIAMQRGRRERLEMEEEGSLQGTQRGGGSGQGERLSRSVASLGRAARHRSCRGANRGRVEDVGECAFESLIFLRC